MKIKVSWSVSVEDGTRTYEPDDLGYSEDEWCALSESEKTSALQTALDNDYEPPYMVVDSFDEF